MSSTEHNEKSSAPFIESRSRSRRWLIPGILFLIGLVILFLPSILINTPLKTTAINYVASDIDGELLVEKAALGWLSPIELRNVRLVGSNKEEVISIESIKTSNSLFGILTGSQIGTIEINRPTLDVIVRPDGSNLEDMLRNYLVQSTDDSSGKLPQMRIDIRNGLARIRSNTLDHAGVFEDINSSIRLMDNENPVEGELKLSCSTESTGPGAMLLKFSIDQGSPDFNMEQIAATFQSDHLPLDAFAPVLTRFMGPSNITGVLNSELEMHFDTRTGLASAQVSALNGRQIAFVAPELIGQDQFVARILDASGEFAIDLVKVNAKEFKMETEFARINADGDFQFDQLIQLGNGAAIPNSKFQLDGIIDLAQIANMLPETAHIRNGVNVKSGLLQITASTRNENNAQRLVLNAETANVNFQFEDQNIVWNQPLRAVAVAGVEDQQLMLDQVQLNSAFLNVNGKASMSDGQLQLDGDLKKLRDQLAQVLDLGGLQLGGIASGNIHWQLANKHNSEKLPFTLTGNFNIQNPIFGYPGSPIWKEPQLQVGLNGTGKYDPQTQLLSLDSSDLNLKTGNENLVARLAKPIADISKDWKYQFNCEANGSIAKWLIQARNFSEFPEFYADGNLESKFLLTLNNQAVRLNQIQFQATNFKFDGFALNIREPKLSGRVNLKYQFDDGSVLFTKSRLTSPSLAASTEQLLFKFTDETTLADGSLSFRGNANRASQWIGFSMPGDSIRWDGEATGSLKFSSEPGQFGGDLIAKIQDLVVVQPESSPNLRSGVQPVSQQKRYVEVWKEPDVRLVSNMTFSHDFNSIQFKNLNIKSKTANVQLDGAINELFTNMVADLNGRWDLNWQEINGVVEASAGDTIKFSGKGWQPIQIKGPIYDESGNYAWIPKQLGGQATVSWQQATILGVPLGKTEVDVQIDQSMARFATQNGNTVVDRILQMQPIMDLRQADPIVYLQKGTMLDQWDISIEDSRTWLKYAAPLIADATAAQGKLSATIEGASVPVFDPYKSSAQGEIEIHALSVGPGPLAQQLIPMVDQVINILKPGSSGLQQKSTWLQLQTQKIPFVVQNGRVFHDGFEMRYKDVVVRTKGSVGFDQSLNLAAEIPILESWVKGDKTLSRLIGKSITVPIAGTLSKPQLDRRSVTQFAQQMIRDTALGAVNDKINSEVGEFQQKVGSQVQDELNRFQGKLNDKIKSEFEDKIQDELRGGLNKLFGGDKK